MLNRLTQGQQVEFLSEHAVGIIDSVANDGLAGVLKTPNGARFTVFACECQEPGERLDALEQIACDAHIPFEWHYQELGRSRKNHQ